MVETIRYEPASDKTGEGEYLLWNSAWDTGTHPLVANTDGDGLDDGVETNTGTYVDAGDTGTDPHQWDTDGDRFSDGVEVLRGTDPTDPQSFPAMPVPGLSSPGIGLLAGLLLLTGWAIARRGSRAVS